MSGRIRVGNRRGSAGVLRRVRSTVASGPGTSTPPQAEQNLLSALFSAEQAGQVFMGHSAPVAVPNLRSRLVIIATILRME